MKTKAEELLEEIQKSLINAHVFWEKPPVPLSDNSCPCVIAAISKADPEKKFYLNIDSGISVHSVKESANEFVDHYNNFMSHQNE